MAYLPKLNPTVGGGLGGLPERRATSGGVSNSVQRSIIGQAVKGSLAYRNTTTNDTYSLDPIEGLTEGASLTLTSKITNTAVATAMFSDGKFVIGYSNANGVCIEIYNFDGTVAVSQITVDNLYVAGNRIALAINPLNEYINVFFASGLSGNTIRRAVYSKTGTQVSAAATLITGVSTSDDQGILDADFFDDEFFVVCFKSSVANEFQSRLYNASGSLVTNFIHYYDYIVGRISVKTMTTSSRTYAVTVSSTGGLVSSGGRGYVQVMSYTGSALTQQRMNLIGDLGTVSAERMAVCYNDVDKEIVGFHCDSNNYLVMAPMPSATGSQSQYAPSKRKYLGPSTPNNFSATNVGGDRYLVTFGGTSSGCPLYAGIINSIGDWVAPPTLVFFKESYTFANVKSAATKLGKSVICAASGTTLLIRTYSHRNTATETYTLKDQYPIKIIDFVAETYSGYPWNISVHATVSTTKLVVAWQTNSYRDITWAIYSSGGTLLNGPYINTDIIGAGNSVTNMKALLLPNGNVALVLQAGSNLKLAIYNSSNVLQGSIITVSTNSTSSDAEVAANGNIFIISRNQTNSYTERAVYSQTGTVVASLATFVGSAISQDKSKIIYSTVNNNFLVTYRNAGTGYFRFSIFNDSGSSLSGDNSFGGAVLQVMTACANADGTFSCYFNNNSNVLYFAKLNSGGSFAVSLTSLNQVITYLTNSNQFQLLPNTASEIKFINFPSESSNINCIALSNSTGLRVSTKKSFGIAAPWVENYYTSEGSSFVRYVSPDGGYRVIVATSLNGDQYIATAWGEVFRLSSSLPSGDYVIDGVVNADAVDSTVPVVTNGLVTRSSKVPRISPFIANATNAKKIIASQTMVAVTS